MYQHARHAPRAVARGAGGVYRVYRARDVTRTARVMMVPRRPERGRQCLGEAERCCSVLSAASSPEEQQLYQSFHGTTEPHASLARQRLTFEKDPSSPTHLSDDDGHYYNTTGSALEYWQGTALPRPTREIEACRRDMLRWGYCLIDEAMSEPQWAAMRERVVEQAAGEREAGVGLWLNASASGSNTQFVTTLLNKGRCFEGACEFDPAYVQAGPLIEQLLSESLGGDFLLNSFQAIIAHQHNYPQALHQDLNGSR
jgi:hypothetical protein